MDGLTRIRNPQSVVIPSGITILILLSMGIVLSIVREKRNIVEDPLTVQAHRALYLFQVFRTVLKQMINTLFTYVHNLLNF